MQSHAYAEPFDAEAYRKWSEREKELTAELTEIEKKASEEAL